LADPLDHVVIDGFLKSQEANFFVIPAKAGIQSKEELKLLWSPVFTGVRTF
jgi:hypothetical protein